MADEGSLKLAETVGGYLGAGVDIGTILGFLMTFLVDRDLAGEAADHLTTMVEYPRGAEYHEGSTEEWHADEEPGYNYDL